MKETSYVIVLTQFKVSNDNLFEVCNDCTDDEVIQYENLLNKIYTNRDFLSQHRTTDLTICNASTMHKYMYLLPIMKLVSVPGLLLLL